MNLNFTISELVHSDTALKYRIDNTPNVSISDNLLKLIFYCLQPIRDKLNKPMIITSGFRCKALNSHPSIKGVSNSQHCTGQAADFVVPGMSIQSIIDFIIKSGIEFDQLINEYDKWVHISFNKGKNRKQVLKY
ncbi:MAG: D-Ala-D-Ala carboxypeptidase family metallohydrolase [Bacteroides sp.]|nr:D-Ala-D-Ala carboxypeptidase family metallohydrolase [Bacteroides sp.]